MFEASLRAKVPEVAREMAEAAARFVDSLEPAQRQKAVFPIDHWERIFWHYTATAPAREMNPAAHIERWGLPLGEMDRSQRELAWGLMASGLSPEGAARAKAIVAHEEILGEVEHLRGTVIFRRDPNLYYFSVFGDPRRSCHWGWRIEGHHLSLHFTLAGDGYASWVPCFFGANPAEVPFGPHKGLRILSAVEDLARSLVLSLDDKQRTLGIFGTVAPEDLMTVTAPKITAGPGTTLPILGLPVARMSPTQRDTLMELINQYVNRVRPELARQAMTRLESRLVEHLHFAWTGSTEKGQAHYYRILGGTFLAEYVNSQNDANHLHSVWRDLEQDFGIDLLRLHYRQHHANEYGRAD